MYERKKPEEFREKLISIRVKTRKDDLKSVTLIISLLTLMAISSSAVSSYYRERPLLVFTEYFCPKTLPLRYEDNILQVLISNFGLTPTTYTIFLEGNNISCKYHSEEDFTYPPCKKVYKIGTQNKADNTLSFFLKTNGTDSISFRFKLEYESWRHYGFFIMPYNEIVSLQLCEYQNDGQNYVLKKY